MNYKLIKIIPPRDFKRTRKILKLSQMDMAEVMGYQRKSYPMIAKYEKGDTSMLTAWKSWEKLQKYMEEKECQS